MAKFSLPKANTSVVRSSLRVPSNMLVRIEASMKSTGFNRKQRSKWLEETTRNFLLRSDAANLVAEEFIVPGSTESIPVMISVELDASIDKMVERVWSEEGARADRSAIFRTAITQQLMATNGMQLSPQETRTRKIAELGGNDDSIN